MKKSFDKISESLNTETDIVDITPTKSEIVKSNKDDLVDQIKKDYEYTRGNLYSLIEKGQESLDGIMELAQESDSPRAYEVAGQIMKSVADTTDKLIDLQKKMKELNKEDDGGPKSVTNNALFVGSTAELAKFLKQQQ
ncbi:terminase small subunit [Synechococcus phage S-T4]|jgi:hypothetical protein|uniref:Terminase small subunit n=1 Tax=Synechococcus phage S-T4 TaxID=2268578 RepID=A0A385EHQ9_9CAUD|nr:terminase small subunit [Synechococcus phage S-T4]AXQ70587.1 terminase small subunit [Synechococcus phage S-T4]